MALSGWLAFLASAAVATPTASAQPVYVHASAMPGGDGGSWAGAFRDLQDGINLASMSGGARNEIWVASGTYKPDRGTGDRAATFNLFSGVVLRGGFAGFETTLGERATTTPPAILSGDIGIVGDSADNSFHVVSMRVLFAPAEIERFTIVAGRADAGVFPNNSGGGMLNEGSTSLRECLFEGNFAVSGGGIFSRFGPISISDSIFRSNTATSEGGGVQVRDGGSVNRCEFQGNSGGFGGGLSTCCGLLVVADCSFEANFGNFGGGLFNSGSTLQLKRSVFLNNSASRGGGAHTGTNSWLVNCFFGGNTADRGGGLFASGSGNAVNCIFSRNFAVSSGGGVWAASSINVASCTMHGNNALLFAGGLYCESGTSTLSNSILWSNTDNTGSGQGAQVTRVGGTLAVNASNIAGWNGTLGGAGNFGSPPHFMNPNGLDGVPGTLDDNFRLQASSPCIDRGHSGLILSDTTDLDDNALTSEATPLDLDMNPRAVEHFFVLPNGPIGSPPTDMGAYEFVPPPRTPGDANGDMAVDFSDITSVLAFWGDSLVPADVDDSGIVGFSDVTMILANWAP